MCVMCERYCRMQVEMMMAFEEKFGLTMDEEGMFRATLQLADCAAGLVHVSSRSDALPACRC